MNRRQLIAMSPGEMASFLADQRVVICATNGRGGWPHLMPLWYLVRDEQVWSWTYAKSQKVRNLERDRRATLQVEAGEEYQELRGVMIEAHAVIHRDPELCTEFGMRLFERYAGDLGEGFEDMVRSQASKRVVLQFVAQRTSSWDHRKLAGVY